MARRTERVRLHGSAPGTRREVVLHRFGRAGARPKAYLQASLHADETPALLVAHHLLRRLDEADAEGAVRGEIVLVPYANPIGLAQFTDGRHQGRYETAGGGNFNRNWPDLTALIDSDALEGRLGDTAEANVAAIRAALLAALDEAEPNSELDSLRLTLAKAAADADLVLDLHCDDEALMHLFIIPQHWPAAEELAAELGCRAVLTAEDSGGGSFDEAFSTPWIRLAQRFPRHPIPPACLSATVELRGRADVDDALADADAGALLRVLQRYGMIDGDPGPAPTAACAATRLDACDTVKAPAHGILSYAAGLGATVAKGDVIAWLIDPAADDPSAARQAIRTETDGLVLSRRDRRYVQPGSTVAKVVGSEPLAHRAEGALLED